jgi:hypothetical protein
VLDEFFKVTEHGCITLSPYLVNDEDESRPSTPHAGCRLNEFSRAQR